MAGTAGARRALPTARKALAGNPGKRALNKDEPVFTPTSALSHRSGSLKKISPRHDHVATDNQRTWHQGLLCVTDLRYLSVCVAYEFWRRAVKILPRQVTPSLVQWVGMSKIRADRQKNEESEMSSTGGNARIPRSPAAATSV